MYFKKDNDWSPSDASFRTDLGYDDFFFKYFHGVVFAAGLFSNEYHFTKSSLSKKLQVVKVTHCLEEGNTEEEPISD